MQHLISIFCTHTFFSNLFVNDFWEIKNKQKSTQSYNNISILKKKPIVYEDKLIAYQLTNLKKVDYNSQTVRLLGELTRKLPVDLMIWCHYYRKKKNDLKIINTKLINALLNVIKARLTGSTCKIRGLDFTVLCRVGATLSIDAEKANLIYMEETLIQVKN